MIYFSSDFHFGHHNILRYCNRPFKNTEEMGQVIVDNWNKLVQPTDIGIILGDVAFGRQSLELVKKLNGSKWLIRGNHDRGFSDTAFKAVGFEVIIEKPYTFDLSSSLGFSFHCMHAPLPGNYQADSINLCGHIHNAWTARYGCLNVGVDQWDFSPLSIIQVAVEYEKAYPGFVSQVGLDYEA